MSSGILNLRYDIGGDLSKLTKSVEKAEALVKEVDDVFVEHGAPKEVYGGNLDFAVFVTDFLSGKPSWLKAQ